MSSSQFSRPLQQLERIISVELLKATGVESCLRESHLREKHLLALLRIIVVLEHLVKHEIQQLLVRHEKLYQFLALDL